LTLIKNVTMRLSQFLSVTLHNCNLVSVFLLFVMNITFSQNYDLAKLFSL